MEVIPKVSPSETIMCVSFMRIEKKKMRHAAIFERCALAGFRSYGRLAIGITASSALLLFQSSRPVPTRVDLLPLFE